MKDFLFCVLAASVCLIGCHGFVGVPILSTKFFTKPCTNKVIEHLAWNTVTKTSISRFQYQHCKAIDEEDGRASEEEIDEYEGEFEDDYAHDTNENEDESTENDDDYKDEDDNPTINLTFSDICEKGFSCHFVGDLMAHVGVECPIDVDEQIGNYMTGDQIQKLLLSINSLDTFDANQDFSYDSMYKLSRDYNLSEKKVKFICDKEKINLPFGMDSHLHLTLQDQFIQAVESGMYDEFHDDLYVPNLPDMDTISDALTKTVAAAERGEV